MLGSLLVVLPVAVLSLQQTEHLPDTLRFKSLAAGGRHSCGITQAGDTYCWGDNQYGQIGDGTRTGPQDPRRYPTLVKGGLELVSLALGGKFSCGITSAGQAYCWGYNYDGQIGNGTDTGEHFAPTAVKGPVEFQAIVAGQAQVCGLDTQGAAYCWGSSSDGQVGDGRAWNRMNISKQPTKVVGGHTFNELALGWDFSCGLASGEVLCWGGVDLTHWSDSIYREPATVSQGKTFSRITATGDHLCGLLDNRASCWGANRQGQLGDSTWTRRYEPVDVVGGLRFFQLTAGATHTCGITPDGKAYCWGEDFAGQLGTGQREYGNQGEPFPLPVYGNLVFTDIVAGTAHTCALAIGGLAYCWGDNRASQVGQSRTKYNYINSPELIAGVTKERQ